MPVSCVTLRVSSRLLRGRCAVDHAMAAARAARAAICRAIERAQAAEFTDAWRCTVSQPTVDAPLETLVGLVGLQPTTDPLPSAPALLFVRTRPLFEG